MKSKYFLLVCLLATIGLVISGCEGKEMNKVDKTLEEAGMINAESHLGLEYLVFSELSEEDYSEDPPETIRTDDTYVHGYYIRYPYKNGRSRLTQICIKNGDYDVFGIALGDNVDDASTVLKQRGYKETKAAALENGSDNKEFKKHDVIIRFKTEAESHTISEIVLLTDIH